MKKSTDLKLAFIVAIAGVATALGAVAVKAQDVQPATVTADVEPNIPLHNFTIDMTPFVAAEKARLEARASSFMLVRMQGNTPLRVKTFNSASACNSELISEHWQDDDFECRDVGDNGIILDRLPL